MDGLSEELDCLLNPPAYMDPDPSLAYLDELPTSSPRPAELPLHKVFRICPTLYSTFSETEKLSVLNFPWLDCSDSASRPAREETLPVTPDDPPQTSEAPHTIPAKPCQTLPLSTDLEQESPPFLSPGFGQSDMVDPNQLDDLVSSTPQSILQDTEPALAIYRGKELIRPVVESGCSSSRRQKNVEKSFSWSRGIGTELSPLQTRSSRKQKEFQNAPQPSTDLQTQDGKALRALKALARTK